MKVKLRGGKFIILIILSFYCLTMHLGYSASLKITASVSKAKDNEIEFFLGYTDGVKKGMELYLIRDGKKIAKVKVIRVFQYSSHGKVISEKEGEKVVAKIGDMVTNIWTEKKITKITKKKEEKERSSIQKKLLSQKNIGIVGKINIILGKEVGINIGSYRGLGANSELWIVRGGKLVGKMKITELGKYYSQGEIIYTKPKMQVKWGDTVIYNPNLKWEEEKEGEKKETLIPAKKESSP